MLTAIEKELYKARKYERHIIGCDYCMVRNHMEVFYVCFKVLYYVSKFIINH